MKSEAPNVDLQALVADLSELRERLREEQGPEDYAHFRTVERWQRACTALGYATAWVIPNPVSMLLIGLGNFARWAGVTHPISHRGYDRIEGVPHNRTSLAYAKGRRRLIDWMDWIVPAAWHHEHDVLHHYRLGEDSDPDQVELNLEWLRGWKLPLVVKYAIVGVFATMWKPAYYAPNTIKELRCETRRKAGDTSEPETMLDWRQWVPITPQGRQLWTRSYLPYVLFRFVVVPALFAPLGMLAAVNVWINSIGAEVVANLLSFTMIVPNHAGDDLPRFDQPVQGKGDFYFRQITGSVNYTSSGFLGDFMQGWLNLHIEHHLFPDLPLSQLRKAAPEVQDICQKHGIPYREAPVLHRLRKAADIMVGKTTMQWSSGAATIASEIPVILPDKPILADTSCGTEAAANIG